MFKRCKVVMLSTNGRASKIRLDNHNKLSFEPYIQGLYYDGLIHSYQHLYILSDEEIKEGDWVLITNETETIKQVHVGRLYLGTTEKVIAATDPSLIIYKDGNNPLIGEFIPCPFPSPSQSFIKKYISEYNKGNKIEEVLVEYDPEFEEWSDESGAFMIPEYLKINKDNTIIIKKIKDNWTREEVIALLDLFNTEYADTTSDQFNKWIESNL